MIERNGWARPLVFNTKTGKLIDGHARLAIALKEGWKEVPVLRGSWTPSQEKELLAGLDTVGHMARVDSLALDSLTQEVANNIDKLTNRTAVDDLILKSMVDVNKFAQGLDPKSPLIKRATASKSVGKKKLRNPPKKTPKHREALHRVMGQLVEQHELFESSNEWGFPDLDPRYLYADDEILPTHTFDTNKDAHHTLAWYCWSVRSSFKDKPVGGFLSFYTDDHRFDGVYARPNVFIPKIVAYNFHGVVEPDFSTYRGWPLVARQWSVYRSRWTARMLQDNMVHVIPTIRRTNDVDRDAPWLYHTLPKNCPFLSINAGMWLTMSGQERKKAPRILRDCLQAVIEHCNPRHVFVYGGVDLERYIAGYLPEVKGHPTYHLIQNFATARSIFLERRKENRAKELI